MSATRLFKSGSAVWGGGGKKERIEREIN
jgi:hypothetical protein